MIAPSALRPLLMYRYTAPGYEQAFRGNDLNGRYGDVRVGGLGLVAPATL